MPSSRRSIRLSCVFCALLAGALALILSGDWLSVVRAQDVAVEEAPPQTSTKLPAGHPGYSFRREHDLNGIGKFYLGREIAHVMGFAGVDWLERDNREQEERLTLLVESLKLKPGMAVADIGAGSGVLTLMMASEVGQTGTVFAVDIQQEMLDRLSDKLNNLNVKNVKLVLGTAMSPELEPDTLDLAIMVDVYHEFEFPWEMLRKLSSAIKPGGRVAFVEYRKEDPRVPIKLVHKMTEKQVRREAERPEFGLTWKETIGVLPRQHIVVFERNVKQPQ
ncbi:class I SAM-dependent methyltransferase [Planctellipticum variicoloris]|uniref:class I SAM-dependent methyltransferase n=1 Tax=Planctellipticum variicoloris TaxID=3064265 RepID=UPI003013C999|nr:methyltransferase domain-containing protein [Planctomycetaceae bacterium SH412]